ncbi:endo-1,4-beta-xylanase [Thermosynechococcus vestitus]|uniref:endo-1,4-beta-xylanase n=1 Tax=Thermosynechococcus vestitus TaxID=146786 RepID=UPI0002E77D58|nr:endo-1,4-beta-xylanase [Thermosynechococcus vestitus]
MLNWRRFLWLSCLAALLVVACGTSSSSVATDALSQKIEQLRQAPLTVVVENAQGRPIPNARLQLAQQSHAFPFGVALDTEMFRPSPPAAAPWYKQTAQENFNAAVHENALKWYQLEPEQGQLDFTMADTILNWVQAQGWPMRGHTLFWEVEEFNPPWLKTLPPAQLRAAVKNHAMTVCHHYRGRINEFDVNNEMLHGNFFRSRLGEDIVKEMFEWCREGNPEAVLYVNDYGIIEGDRLKDYVEQIRDLLAQGVPIGGIGIQAHLESPLDEAKMQRALDTLAQFNLPLKITEVSVSLADEQQQAQTLRQIYRIGFAHPAVKEILLWGFWAGNHWRPQAGLYRQDFAPKPAAIAYRKLLFEDWWTRVSGRTNAQGQWQGRGYLGRYRLTVAAQGQTQTREFELSQGGTTVTVRL